MGRREERDALQSTWVVLETAEGPPRPFTAKDLQDAEARAEAEVAELKSARARGIAFQIPSTPPACSRRVHLPTLARAADYQPTEAAQVPMPK